MRPALGRTTYSPSITIRSVGYSICLRPRLRTLLTIATFYEVFLQTK